VNFKAAITEVACTDALRVGRGSFAICGAQFGNHLFRLWSCVKERQCLHSWYVHGLRFVSEF